MNKISIIIPARYGSTRFPGKPLAMIAGKSMLERVVDIARDAAHGMRDVDVIVTTEDQRIADHAREIGVHCIVTSEDCPTGSDRVLQAAQKSGHAYEFIINLQGDNPFPPPEMIKAMIFMAQTNPALEVVTPAHQLSWEAFDALRHSKKTTPFTGTTVVADSKGKAIWFSKNIIPAIRSEEKLRAQSPLSPVWQHVGVYGYRTEILEKFCTTPQTEYEILEGLEQLRLIEMGVHIEILHLQMEKSMLQAGIDSPEDLIRAEKYFTS